MDIYSGSVWNNPHQVEFSSLRKFSLLNLNKAWIAINTKSLFLIFFFSSFFALLPFLVLLPNFGNQQIGDAQQPYGHDEEGMPQVVRHVDVQGVRRRERKRGCGGISKRQGACWLDALVTLKEVSLNRHED